MEREQSVNLITTIKVKADAMLQFLKKPGKSVDLNSVDQVRKTMMASLHHTYTQITSSGKAAIGKLMSSDWRTAGNFVKDNKPLAVAGSCLVIVSLVGVYSFVNIDQNLFGPKQVDFLVASTAANQAVKVNELTLENISNVNSARRIGITGFSIFANDKAIGFASTLTEANQILDELKKTYTVEGSKETWFVETVEIKPDRLDVVRFDGSRSLEEAVQQIARGTTEVKEHVIQDGENLWLVAKKYQVSMDTLISANPSIDPENVKINQKLSLVVPKPMISVACKEVKEYNDIIPFDVAYEESSGMYKGESTLKRAGVQGERFVKAEIILVNGKEVERNILEEKISKNPVGKIVVQGTKIPPPKIGSGTFVRPTSRGIVTSRYGGRWGRMHEGIDLGLPIGSQIKASDGGRVTFSGYKNGYGLCVIIDHGSGVTTLYGHCNQLQVKQGQSVFQGQAIAKSGNSGRSTGPHLHFEVRKNGNPVNPAKYVRF